MVTYFVSKNYAGFCGFITKNVLEICHFLKKAARQFASNIVYMVLSNIWSALFCFGYCAENCVRVLSSTSIRHMNISTKILSIIILLKLLEEHMIIFVGILRKISVRLKHRQRLIFSLQKYINSVLLESRIMFWSELRISLASHLLENTDVFFYIKHVINLDYNCFLMLSV